jgi:hypothetical protein
MEQVWAQPHSGVFTDDYVSAYDVLQLIIINIYFESEGVAHKH